MSEKCKQQYISLSNKKKKNLLLLGQNIDFCELL